MFIRYCKCRPVLTATLAACALCIGIFCILKMTKTSASTSTSHFVFSNLAIHRHLGNGVYKVDPTPVLELAREIVNDDKSSKVSFDEASGCVIVTSTQENLQRIGTRFHNMYRAIGVELRKASPSESQDILRSAQRIPAKNDMR